MYVFNVADVPGWACEDIMNNFSLCKAFALKDPDRVPPMYFIADVFKKLNELMHFHLFTGDNAEGKA